MNVLLGISGGIAAYKAADLVSQLVKLGHQVRVIMTPHATQFVGPLTFEALSAHPVMTDALATGASTQGLSAIAHIDWAKWAQLAVVAPLTASTLGKLACGIADNALLTVLMAVPATTPVVLCPAMNTQMWNHPLTQRNLGWLADTGRFTLVEPTAKRLACGDVGLGALADVGTIVDRIRHLTAPEQA